MRPLVKGLDQTTHAPQLAVGLWFEYVRLLGTPTALSVAVATFLHGCYCELSDQSIHWGTAGLIIFFGLGMSVAFWLRPHGLAWAIACGILIAALVVNLRWAEGCEVHQAFLMVLTCIAAGTAMASGASRSSAGVVKMSAPEGTSPGSGLTPIAPEAVPSGNDWAPAPQASLEDHRPGNKTGHARGKWLTISALLLGFGVYMIVVPALAMLWDMWNPRPTIRRELTEMSLAEYFRLHTVSGVIMAMFLAMGASLGSFLNVFIFRLPRGRTLLWPPSACAACGTRIAGRDNIPVLAWLNLSGKCRHCGISISSRYPLVEALIASIFVLFFYLELLSGGANLPVRTSNAYNGIVWILFYTKWDLLTMYLFHMLVLTCLFSWGMINFDRFRVPKQTVWLGILGVTALVSLAPHLNPLLAHGGNAGSRLAALNCSLLGVGVGGLGGALMAWFFKLDNAQFSSDARAQVFHQQQPGEEFSAENLPEEKSLAENRPEEKLLVSAVGLANVEQTRDVDEAMAGLSNDVDRNESDHQCASAGQMLPIPAIEPAGYDLYGSRAAAPTRTTDATGALAMLGAAFGYQAVIWIGLVTTVLTLALLLLKPVGRRWSWVESCQVPVTVVLFGVAVVHLAVWKWIHI